jgi:hypothetical protein
LHKDSTDSFPTEEVKQELTTQLESVFASLCTKLKIPTDDPFSDAPPKIEGEHSSHSHTFQHHHFQCDLCLPRVDVTKFDGSDTTCNIPDIKSMQNRNKMLEMAE